MRPFGFGLGADTSSGARNFVAIPFRILLEISLFKATIYPQAYDLRTWTGQRLSNVEKVFISLKGNDTKTSSVPRAS